MFVQDDWQISSRLKLLYGVRYDLFDVPAGAAVRTQSVFAELHDRQEQLRSARRRLVVGRQQARTVVRASIGLMYEPPLLDFYDNAILNNGDPKSYNVGPLLPTAAGAPAFPASLASPPPGFVLPKQSINAVDPELRDPVGVAEQRPARTCAQ